MVEKKGISIFESIAFLRKQYVFPILINPEFAKRMNVFDKLKEHDIDITGASISNAYEIKKRTF